MQKTLGSCRIKGDNCGWLHSRLARRRAQAGTWPENGCHQAPPANLSPVRGFMFSFPLPQEQSSSPQKRKRHCVCSGRCVSCTCSCFGAADRTLYVSRARRRSLNRQGTAHAWILRPRPQITERTEARSYTAIINNAALIGPGSRGYPPIFPAGGAMWQVERELDGQIFPIAKSASVIGRSSTAAVSWLAFLGASTKPVAIKVVNRRWPAPLPLHSLS